MKTKLFKTFTALFLLLLFTSGKIIGFHEFFHNHHDHHNHNDRYSYFGQYEYDFHHDYENHQDEEDQKEDCELCDKILIDLFSPYSEAVQSTEIAEVPKHFHENITEEYTSENHTIELSTVLFSRPPPALN